MSEQDEKFEPLPEQRAIEGLDRDQRGPTMKKPTDPVGGDLVDRVVAFIDILGFTDIVKNACAGDESSLLRVRSALRSIWSQHFVTNEGLMGMKNLTPEARATAFSDNIVISDLNKPSEISRVFREVAFLAKMLLCAGTPCRGGIATGKMLHNDQVVFGVGLLKAYTLEHDIAVYPRIVVQDDLVQHASPSFSTRLKRDSDGVYFIDVFKELRITDADTTLKFITGQIGYDDMVNTPDVDAFVSVHKLLVTALANTAGDVRRHTKYRWLANQFNEGVTDYVPGQVEQIKL